MPKSLIWLIITSAFVLFGCSSLRHALFQSNAFDLGLFDQAIYLISQGKEPVVSLAGFHFLGDHAALVLYPLGLFYKIYPNVHWLFAIQAISLSMGALPIFYLARKAHLKDSQSVTVAAIYLLYPLIFNINLFDFHPEIIALPAFLVAILAAKLNKVWRFCAAIIVVLGCKAALALTVAAMGFWLIICEKRRLCGAIALLAGVGWFIIATLWIIPVFSGSEVSAVGRYAYLGNSVLEIIQNLFLKPHLVFSRIFSINTLEYLALLLSPIIWISPLHLSPLIAAIPTLIINILSDSPAQRNLVHQYSLPILPFLLLVVINSLSAKKAWLSNKSLILTWSLISFLALAKYGYFGSIYLKSLDTWQATKTAIAQVKTKGGVLAPSQFTPHLTHRSLIKLAQSGSENIDLSQFEYVLLNLRHPGFGSTSQVVTILLERIKNLPEFQLIYQHDDVFCFQKRSNKNKLFL